MLKINIQMEMNDDENTNEMTEDEELREKVSNFLRRNFPQIQMHGGSATISEIDSESGMVRINLGGACSGCGISPMTTQAIKRRMKDEIEEIKEVKAKTSEGASGFGTGSESIHTSGETRDSRDIDAPF